MIVHDILGLRYCVYGHYINDCCVYVGMGTLYRAFSDNSARRNESWHKTVQGKKLDVVVFCRFATKTEARKYEIEKIYELNPCCNIQRTERGSRGVKVYCTTNNTTYPSISIAAKTLGLTYSGIYEVVSGKVPRCKGYNFERL